MRLPKKDKEDYTKSCSQFAKLQFQKLYSENTVGTFNGLIMMGGEDQ